MKKNQIAAIVETCERIVEAFDSLEHQYTALDIRQPNEITFFTRSCMKETVHDIYSYVEGLYDKKLIDDEHWSNFGEMMAALDFTAAQVPLAFGFALGQMIDIPYPKVQKDIDALQKILRKEKLLPFFPRQRTRQESAEGRTA